MKDGVSFTYRAPKVDILNFTQDDVIQTSLLALFEGKLLKKSWNEWTGMETNSIWEDMD